MSAGTKIILLSQGKQAIVDAEDYDFLMQWKWSAGKSTSGNFYATRSIYEPGSKTSVLMHRVILGSPAGLQVDHRDGNGLNNTRSNLRLATPAQNNRNRRRSSVNRSGFKGVCWHRERRKWRAQITINNKSVHLGYFSSREEAANTYKNAAIETYGEFARMA